MKAVYFVLHVSPEYDESVDSDGEGLKTRGIVLPWTTKDYGNEDDVELGVDPKEVVIKTEQQLRRFIELEHESGDDGDTTLVRMDNNGTKVLDTHRGHYQPRWD